MAENLGEGYVWIGVRDQGFEKKMGRVRNSFQSSMNQMDKMAQRARWALLIGAGALTVVARAAGSFEQSMSRVEALSGASGRSLEALQEQALELGRTTVFSANQSADAMAAFALAGFDAEKIMASLPATLNLAAAGELEVGEAADIAAKIMAGMEIEAEDLAKTVDVLAKAFTTANTDLRELGEAMKFVGPVANSVGLSLEETVAIIQLMSNAGITGSMAGTSLRRALSALAAPATQAVKIFKSLNVELKEQGRQRDPISILRDMEVAMKRVQGEAERTGIVMTIFGQRAGPAMTVLLEKGLAAFEAYRDAALSATGTATDIATTRLDNFVGARTLLPNSLGEMSDKEVEAAVNTATMTARLLALVAIMPLLTRGITGLWAAIASGSVLALNPVTILVTALAASLGMLALAFVEAKVKGIPFLDVLEDYGQSLGLLGDKMDDLIEKQTKSRKIEKEAIQTAGKLREEERTATPEELEQMRLAAEEEKKAGAPRKAAALKTLAEIDRQAGQPLGLLRSRIHEDARRAARAEIELAEQAMGRTNLQDIYAEAKNRAERASIIADAEAKFVATREQAAAAQLEARETQERVLGGVLGLDPSEITAAMKPPLSELGKAAKALRELAARQRDLQAIERRGLITPEQARTGHRVLGVRAAGARETVGEARERLQEMGRARADILEQLRPEERRTSFAAIESFGDQLATQMRTESEKRQRDKERNKLLGDLKANTKDGNDLLQEIRDAGGAGWSNS
jgi:TP901 family phage tail tape measure protein